MINYTSQELKPSISREEIIEFIDGNLSEKSKANIRKKNEYKLLFEIVELAGTARKWSFKRVPTKSYSDIENLIEKILSGEVSRKESRAFINALRNSHSFYQKVMVHLKNMTPEIMNEDVPELSQVKMQTVEQTVDFIKKTLGGVERKTEQQVSVIENRVEIFVRGVRDLFKPIPTIVYASVLLIIVLTSYNFYADWNQQRIFLAKFSYDTHVPLEYTKSGFRDTAEISETSQLSSLFKIAIRDYNSKEYKASVNTFRTMETKAEKLTNTPEPAEFLLDYYLYYGLSHLALSTGNEQGLSEIEKERQGRSAINLLLKARDYSASEAVTNQNISYFLGVAYWFADEKDKALVHLKNVSKDSEFYDRSQLLIGELKD